MRIEENFDLTLFNSYRIKSNCKRAFFPRCEKDFVTIYRDYPSRHPKVILGGGYNVILSKEYYEQDFVLIGDSFSQVEISGTTICAEAGIGLQSLSELALAHSLYGMEMFYDIPSSLGGAVVMNAGASGEEIKDILAKGRYLDLTDLKVKEISNEAIGFEYRNSFFQRNPDKIVLRVWLQLKKGEPQQIRGKMERIRNARWTKQPKDFPNAGSVFKRPKGQYVGAMIEELGLKGFSCGGAKISEKHGGFIVNFNEASGTDILDIIEEVKKRVRERFELELEVEQRII